MTAPITPRFVSNLKERNFKEIAKAGSYAYGYLCADTFKLYYVGVARTPRRPFSKEHNTIVPTKRNHVILLKSGLTREQAAQQEKRYVARYGRIDKGTGILHNRTAGGVGTRDLSDGSLANLRAAAKAAKNTPEARAMMSAIAKARYSDPEARARHSVAMKAALSTSEARAQLSAARAASNAPEARAKISAAAKARYSNLDARAKHSAVTKAAHSTPEVRAIVSARNKAKAAKQVAQGAAELGISVDTYMAMPRSSRALARKRKREGIQAGPGNAARAAQGATELGISLDAYMAMSEKQRFYARKKKWEANA